MSFFLYSIKMALPPICKLSIGYGWDFFLDLERKQDHLYTIVGHIKQVHNGG